jgi:hypothetical protein
MLSGPFAGTFHRRKAQLRVGASKEKEVFKDCLKCEEKFSKSGRLRSGCAWIGLGRCCGRHVVHHAPYRRESCLRTKGAGWKARRLVESVTPPGWLDGSWKAVTPPGRRDGRWKVWRPAGSATPSRRRMATRDPNRLLQPRISLFNPRGSAGHTQLERSRNAYLRQLLSVLFMRR